MWTSPQQSITAANQILTFTNLSAPPGSRPAAAAQVANVSPWILSVTTLRGVVTLQPFTASTVPVGGATEKVTVSPTFQAYTLASMGYVQVAWMEENERPPQPDGPLTAAATAASAPAWATAPFVNALNAIAVGPTSYPTGGGTFAVGPFNGLFLNLTPVAPAFPGWRVTVTWYADAAGTTSTNSQTFRNPTGGSGINSVIQNFGPYVTFSLGATSYAPNPHYSFLAYPLLSIPSVAYGLPAKQIAANGVNIAAGGTQSFLSAYGFVGKAHVGVSSGSPNFSVILFGQDETATYVSTYGGASGGVGANGNAVNFDCYVDGNTPVVQIKNTDAGIQGFNYELTAAA